MTEQEHKDAMINELIALEADFRTELASGSLTTAQRIAALSEIRRCKQFRAVLMGLIPMPEHGSEASGQ